MFTPRCCNTALIETQCWPPTVGTYGRRFDGYVPLAAGGCKHIKLTSGGVYLPGGYTHVSLADEGTAASTTQNVCCGVTADAITRNCPGLTVFFTDYMP
jgi:hypothetical protein